MPVTVDRTGLVLPVLHDKTLSPTQATWLWILLLAPWAVPAAWTGAAVREFRARVRVVL